MRFLLLLPYDEAHSNPIQMRHILFIRPGQSAWSLAVHLAVHIYIYIGLHANSTRKWVARERAPQHFFFFLLNRSTTI